VGRSVATDPGRRDRTQARFVPALSILLSIPFCVLCVFCGLSNSVAADVSRRIQAGQAPTQVGQSPSICVFRVLCGHSTP